MIPFNLSAMTGREILYITEAMEKGKLSGDGSFTERCHQWFYDNINCHKALLTTSGTHALEICALLADIGAGDEVIMPSYTFASTANAFVLRGAKIVFVDIRPDMMNIDENLIESAITEKTRAIVPVHYAGVACEMDSIMSLAEKYNLVVIEDAAHAVLGQYKGKFLGTIGHMGCFSFHDTKNLHCGEGGAVIINDQRFSDRAEIIRNKGTNRSLFLRGQVDKYTWIDLGSSYLPSEINAAFLYAQLESAEEITADRLASWRRYYSGLQPLAVNGFTELPHVPEYCRHNAGLFYLKVKDIHERGKLMDYLRCNGVATAFHYIPLHSSEAGMKYCRFNGNDIFTTRDSERLVRLPLFYRLNSDQTDYIVKLVRSFFNV